jgi:hypothetical protein
MVFRVAPDIGSWPENGQPAKNHLGTLRVCNDVFGVNLDHEGISCPPLVPAGLGHRHGGRVLHIGIATTIG